MPKITNLVYKYIMRELDKGSRCIKEDVVGIIGLYVIIVDVSQQKQWEGEAEHFDLEEKRLTAKFVPTHLL